MARPISPQLIRGYPLSRGLLFAYLLQEGAGDSIADSSPNGINGVLNSPEIWVPDGLQFDGSDYINVPVISNSGSYTVVARLDFIAGNNPYLFDCQTGRLIITGQSPLRVYDGTWGTGISMTAGEPKTIGVVFDAANSVYSIWIDSVKQLEEAYTPRNLSGYFIIGARYSHNNNWLKSLLEFFIMYDRALQPAEMSRITSDPHSVFRASTMAAAYTFAEGASVVNVSWTDNTGGQARHRVERAEAASGPFTEIATVNAGVDEYDDEDLAAGTYWYRVCALGVGNARSDYITEEITVS